MANPLGILTHGPCAGPRVCATYPHSPGSWARVYVDSVKNGERRVEWRRREKEHELREAVLSRGCVRESEAERRRETERMDMEGKGWVEGGGARRWRCWETEERNSENRGRKRK